MILGDQGEGGYQYQVVNSGEPVTATKSPGETA
jgi:hypothetical protein